MGSDRFAKIVRSISMSVSIPGYPIMFFLVFATMADVFMRFLFGSPIQGVIEHCIIFTPVLVFTGLAYVQLMDGHIRVTFLLGRLKPRSRAILDICTLIISLIFAIIMGIHTWKAAVYSLSIREYYYGGAGQAIPVWWAKFSPPIGFWALSLQYIAHILKKITQLPE